MKIKGKMTQKRMNLVLNCYNKLYKDKEIDQEMYWLILGIKAKLFVA